MANPLPTFSGEWTTTSLFQPYISAINERRAVAQLGGFIADIEVGDDVHSVNWLSGLISALQFKLSQCLFYYVDSSSGSDFTGKQYGSDLPFYVPSTFASAAGLTYPGYWRAYTKWPSEEGSEVATRSIAAGDLIGPWLFEDLVKAIGVLKYTAGYCETVPIASRTGESTPATDKTWEEHQSEAEANTQDDPYGISHTWREHRLWGGDPLFIAQAAQRAGRWEYQHAAVPTGDNVPSMSWDCYYKLTGWTYGFDAAGLGYIEGWNKEAGLGATAKSSPIGSTSAFPTWANAGKGFQDVGAWALYKWAFSHSD